MLTRTAPSLKRSGKVTFAVALCCFLNGMNTRSTDTAPALPRSSLSARPHSYVKCTATLYSTGKAFKVPLETART